NNLLNNRATADTTILGVANFTIAKRQIAPVGTVNAGELVTYTVTITDTGAGLARSVDIKDALPAGMTLERISASNSGVCGGTVCQFGTLSINATRTITVVARVAANTAAGSLTNTAAVYSIDDPTPDTATAATTIATSADVSVTKVDLIDPVGPTDDLLYQI